MLNETREWFVSDEEVEMFELLYEAFGESLDSFYAEKKAQSLNFARRFNLDLLASGDNATAAINDICQKLQVKSGQIIRAPSRRQLYCLMANLYHLHTKHPKFWLIVSRRFQETTSTRFNPSGIVWKTQTKLTDLLLELGYLQIVRGHFKRSRGAANSKQTRIRATQKLIDLLEHGHGWSNHIIGIHEEAEPIIMKGLRDENGQRKIIEYEDTKASIADRDLINRYNYFIRQQDIRAPFTKNIQSPDLIFTRRIFSNGSWDEGGRLFGGEFQNLPKTEREKITINNEAVCEIDIASCHATMAFADIGNDWFGNSGEDIYQVFKAASWPRDVIKLAFNIMMNTSSEEKATKAIIKKVADENLNLGYEELDRPGWCKNLFADIKAAYPELTPNFFQRRGMRYMRQEGDIALIVIGECLQHNVPVLTLHDSYIAPTQHRALLTGLIKAAFKKVVGVNCVVR